MILADTSVWVAHFRSNDAELARRLDAGEVLSHPFIVGELAMGNLRDRATVLGALQRLPAAVIATDDEVLGFIERQGLHGLGVGYVDAHLLASVHLTRDTWLWTTDRRLQEVAARMGVGL